MAIQNFSIFPRIVVATTVLSVCKVLILDYGFFESFDTEFEI